VEAADAPDTRPRYIRRYWQKRDDRAGLAVAARV